jgi:hypothetical protein
MSVGGLVFFHAGNTTVRNCYSNHSAVQHTVVVVALLISVLIVGCGADDPVTPSPTATSVPPRNTETPTTSGGVTESPLESPLPTPSEAIPWDQEPAAGKANLRGRIVVSDPTVLVGELFLAVAVPTDMSDIELLELDTEVAPQAYIDRATGQFLFVDVEPGRYGLIAWEPMNSGAVTDPETGETLFLELSAGEVKDLDTLEIP